MSYVAARSLDEALAALAPGARVIAGGTDFYPALGEKTLDGALVDISEADDLRAIEAGEDGWRFGAVATWSDVIAAPLPPVFDGLKAAAREVGAIQIQNVGTLAGNLCNASPAADGVPALLALDAEVEIASREGRRTLPLKEFITGPRRTALSTGEIVSAILVPQHDAAARGGFAKLGARRHLVISIIMASVVVTPDGDRIAAARVAVGAASPVAVRLETLEAALAGAPLADAAGLVAPHHFDGLAPIDDVRGTADYRVAAACEAVCRLVGELTRTAR